MGSEHDGRGRKFCAIYDGVVVDNADPLKIGRARVRVPGVVEPMSGWALPRGGGGCNHRGIYAPPNIGDEVAVFFNAGDVDCPRYIPGHPGAPSGVPETPGPVGGYHGSDESAEEVSSSEAPLVKSWEGSRYVIIADERPGKERFVLRDKTTGDQVMLDGKDHVVQIQATAVLDLRSTGLVRLTGASVEINGRVVVSNGRPIQ